MAFNSLSPALLTHPFMFELLQMTIIIIVIGFTSTSSIIRPAISPLILAISVYSLPRCFDKVQHTIWLGILGGNSTASILQYIELAFLGRYAIEFGGPSNPDRNLRFKQGQEAKAKAIRAKGHYTVWERIKFGVSSLSNHRLIGTLFEVSGVPPFSSKDPDYVPTRSEFLRRRSLTVLLCYLVIDLLGAAPHDPGMIATTYPAQLVPFFSRLGEVTVEQINMRFITSIMTWVSVYCIIHASHGVMATIGVASGLTEVKDWPPSFGSLGDAYTVRGFWGLFWHQTNRHKLSAPSSWLTYSFLKLRKGSILGRYLFCFLVFLISGVQHAFIDVTAGIPWSRTGAIRVFVTQFLGVVLEDTAQELWRRSGGKPGGKLVKVIGFLWVFAFLAWSVPAWLYPIMRVDLGNKDRGVPFSAVKPLLGLWN